MHLLASADRVGRTDREGSARQRPRGEGWEVSVLRHRPGADPRRDRRLRQGRRRREDRTAARHAHRRGQRHRADRRASADAALPGRRLGARPQHPPAPDAERGGDGGGDGRGRPRHPLLADMAQSTQTKDPSFSPDWRFQEPVAWRDTDLDENILTEWFHYILLGRQIDYRFQVLNRQGRAPFIISCAGHEAAQIGVGWPLKPKHDWLAPYYRDVVLCMRMGVTPLDLMLAVLAKSADPASGGKQTPGHFSDSRLNITSGGSPVATQMVRGAGVAYAKEDGRDRQG